MSLSFPRAVALRRRRRRRRRRPARRRWSLMDQPPARMRRPAARRRGAKWSCGGHSPPARLRDDFAAFAADKARTGYAQTASLLSRLSPSISLLPSCAMPLCSSGMTITRSGVRATRSRDSFHCRLRLRARLRENYDVVAADGSVNFSRIRCRLLLPPFAI